MIGRTLHNLFGTTNIGTSFFDLAVLANWILATDVWNDAGVWDDSDTWND